MNNRTACKMKNDVPILAAHSLEKLVRLISVDS